MQRLTRLLLVFSLIVIATDRLVAQENLEQKIADQQKLADEAQARKAAGEPAVTTARATAKDRAAAVATLKIEQNKAEAAIRDADGKLPKLQEAIKKATEERTKSETELAAAAKAAQDAKGKETEQAEADKSKAAAEKLVAATKALDEALKAVLPVEETVAASRKLIAEQPPKIKAAEQAVAVFQPELQNAEAAFAALSKEAVGRQIELETSLVAAGRLVSFAKQVAPIFSQRCLACHNARTAKGRLNMENFANLTKGGESGASVVAGKPGESLLQTMIEDHSMPKDSDPLLPEQIAVIKKWIETGARLDAGIASTATFDHDYAQVGSTSDASRILPRCRFPVMKMPSNFSPDGNLLATSGYREVLLWNPADGQPDPRHQELGRTAP